MPKPETDSLLDLCETERRVLAMMLDAEPLPEGAAVNQAVEALIGNGYLLVEMGAIVISPKTRAAVNQQVLA